MKGSLTALTLTSRLALAARRCRRSMPGSLALTVVESTVLGGIAHCLDLDLRVSVQDGPYLVRPATSNRMLTTVRVDAL